MNDLLNEAFAARASKITKDLFNQDEMPDYARDKKRAVAAVAQLLAASGDVPVIIADSRTAIGKLLEERALSIAELFPGVAYATRHEFGTRHCEHAAVSLDPTRPGITALPRNFKMLFTPEALEGYADAYLVQVLSALDATGVGFRTSATRAVNVCSRCMRALDRMYQMIELVPDSQGDLLGPNGRAALTAATKLTDLTAIREALIPFFISGIPDSLNADFVLAVERATFAYVSRIFIVGTLGRYGAQYPFWDLPIATPYAPADAKLPDWSEARHEAWSGRAPWRMSFDVQEPKGLRITRDRSFNFADECRYPIRIYSRSLRSFKAEHAEFVLMAALCFGLDPRGRIYVSGTKGSTDDLYVGVEAFLPYKQPQYPQSGAGEDHIHLVRKLIDSAADYLRSSQYRTSLIRLDDSGLLFFPLNSAIGSSYPRLRHITQCDYWLGQQRVSSTDDEPTEVQSGIVDFLWDSGFVEDGHYEYEGVFNKFVFDLKSLGSHQRVRLQGLRRSNG